MVGTELASWLMAQFVTARIEAFAHTIVHGGSIPLWGVPQAEGASTNARCASGRIICFQCVMSRVKLQNKSLSLGTKHSLSGTLLPCG